MTMTHKCGYVLYGECDGIDCTRACSSNLYTPPQIDLPPFHQPLSARGCRLITVGLSVVLAFSVFLSWYAGSDNISNVNVAEARQ